MIWIETQTTDFAISTPDNFYKTFIFYYLSPFSYARKKKDQKEARPSAGGRFFRESLLRHKPD